MRQIKKKMAKVTVHEDAETMTAVSIDRFGMTCHHHYWKITLPPILAAAESQEKSAEEQLIAANAQEEEEEGEKTQAQTVEASNMGTGSEIGTSVSRHTRRNRRRRRRRKLNKSKAANQ